MSYYLIKSVEQFWSNIRVMENGCWIFDADKSHKYYRIVAIPIPETDGAVRRTGAHRYAWELVHGYNPMGFFVCHHCDTPPCIRPDHLFLGKPVDNTRDMIEKNRNARAQPNQPYYNVKKLTVSEIREIRKRGESSTMLASIYNVSVSMVCRIRKGNRWQHVA